MTDQIFVEKAIARKRPMIHTDVTPKNAVVIEEDVNAFQGLKAVPVGEPSFPLTMKAGDSVILDFGDHCVGYMNFTLDNSPTTKIVDSPCMLRFSFGEFPLELCRTPEEYVGTLGNGWAQTEIKKVIFAPYTGALERRYSFRYVKIERIDNAKYDIRLSDIYADCVSAVELDKAPASPTDDELLKSIYDMSVKTLKECEQDVFEDGPKRDRRLWIGDLRLQAVVDYGTFRNMALVERCLYLFAAYRQKDGRVAPYVFPDSPPYVDGFFFSDYSLFFATCLYDYAKAGGDMEIVKELYPTAKEQIELGKQLLQRNVNTFIDWCPGLDKSAAALGVFVYVLRQYKELTEMLGYPTEEVVELIDKATEALMNFYSEDEGLFVTKTGQISVHSQVWGILSGVLSAEQSLKLAERIDSLDVAYTPRTPYMMHYYIESLWSVGLKEKAMHVIRGYWGQLVTLGLDCCIEIFNPKNHMESPYNAPEINSACHAWSCTPAYWIQKYFSEK